MNRRSVLHAAAGLTGGMALAGCSRFFSVSEGEPPLVENRPSAVYYPTHTEGMTMLGTSGMDGMDMGDAKNTSETNATSEMNGSSRMDPGNATSAGKDGASDYAFGLLYSYPHRFWTINGDDRQMVSIKQEDSVHLMASVWEPTTRVVLPDTGLSIEITQDGALVSQESIYPMVSQPMGFHYGANFALDGDGTYTATLSVGGMSTRRTGRFVGLFEEPASVTIEFEYSQQTKEEIPYNRTEGRAGDRAADEPMQMEMLPNSIMPPTDELPGEIVGTQTSGDGRFVTTVLGEPPRGITASGPYIAVSARTPYNRMVLPAMALSGTLRRDGETVFEGPLKPTLDPDCNYHYGTTVEDLQSGDELEVSVEVPPQVARHEGYETAFLDMSPMTFTV